MTERNRADHADVMLTIRVSVELRDLLREVAEADGRTMSNYARRVLERELLPVVGAS